MQVCVLLCLVMVTAVHLGNEVNFTHSWQTDHLLFLADLVRSLFVRNHRFEKYIFWVLRKWSAKSLLSTSGETNKYQKQHRKAWLRKMRVSLWAFHCYLYSWTNSGSGNSGWIRPHLWTFAIRIPWYILEIRVLKFKLLITTKLDILSTEFTNRRL